MQTELGTPRGKPQAASWILYQPPHPKRNCWVSTKPTRARRAKHQMAQVPRSFPSPGPLVDGNVMLLANSCSLHPWVAAEPASRTESARPFCQSSDPMAILPLTSGEPRSPLECGAWSRAAQCGEGVQCPRGRTLTNPGSEGRALTLCLCPPNPGWTCSPVNWL